PVRARAAREDLPDALELTLAAELARVRLDVPERAADELRDRHAVAPAGGEVHHRRLEPVARRQPLVLARENAVVRWDLPALAVQLAVVLDERLAVRRDGDGVLDPRDCVADADLDRADPRVGPDVPPDVRVVGDAAGPFQLVHDLRVIGVVVEPRRRAGARE